MELHRTKIYARLVAWARRFVVLSLSLFLVLLMGWPFFQSLPTFFSKTEPKKLLSKLSVVENVMEAPRFMSKTHHGESYEIWALRAKDVLSNQVSLIQPEGKLIRMGGDWMALRAARGKFQEKEGLLLLEDHVAVHNVMGYHLKTDCAYVNLKDKQIEGPNPVEASGPAGQAAAQSFSLQETAKDRVLVLKGKARLLIVPGESTEKP